MENEIKEEVTEEKVTEEVKDEKVKEKPKKEIKNKLKEENAKLLEEIKTLKDELLRNRADLENFKKHMNEERIKDRKYASESLVTDIVGPLEYLVKACEFQSDNAEMNNFLIGFKMIANQLQEVLERDGLKEIDAKAGMDFDPAIHHAMDKEQKEGLEANKIISVYSKGYKYKERIIKPAMVKVSE